MLTRRVAMATVGIHLASLAISVALHLGVAAPFLVYRAVTFDPDTAGEEGSGTGTVGNGGVELLEPPGPVSVSLYVEPKTDRPATSDAPAPSGGAKTGGPAATTASTTATDEGTAAATSDGSGRLPREGVPGGKPRGARKPCEATDEIVAINDHTWRVDRDLLDYYAGHLRKLEKQAGVASHRGPDGKRDGARLYLPRCSLLKQAGFRNGDVVHRVNGRKVSTIPQGVATWLAVRNDRVLRVELTRRNGERRVHRYRLR